MSDCSLAIDNSICSLNFDPTRGCFASPVAFVFHGIDVSLHTYLGEQATKYPYGWDRFTKNPKSVHFLIGASGSVFQLVETFNSAWGLSGLIDPVWPLLNSFEAFEANEPFIHLGFEGTDPNTLQIDVAAQLVCCLAKEFGIPVNSDYVMVARDLDARQTNLWSLPTTLIPKAQVCALTDGTPTVLASASDVDALEDQVESLEETTLTLQEQVDANTACCEANTQAIADLQAAVEAINIASLEQRISALEDGNLALQKEIVKIYECLEVLGGCDPTSEICLSYRAGPFEDIFLVPGAFQRINMPTRISDTSPVPLVQTGPLWCWAMSETVGCGTYEITFVLALEASEFCAGDVISTYINVCGNRMLMASTEAEEGTQAITLSGSLQINHNAACPNVWFEAKLESDTITAAKTVTLAQVSICCLDGLISNPV